MGQHRWGVFRHGPGEKHPKAALACSVRQGLTRSASRPLPFLRWPRCSIGFLTSRPWPHPLPPAANSAASSVHIYPDRIRGGLHQCEQQFFGRRGKPVKKMRFVPAEKAFAIARKLQGTRGCTVSVI